MSFIIKGIEPSEIIFSRVPLTEVRVKKGEVITTVWEKQITPPSWHTIWSGNIGEMITSDTEAKSFEAPITYPTTATGLKVTGRLVSFNTQQEFTSVPFVEEISLDSIYWTTLAEIQDETGYSKVTGMRYAGTIAFVLEGTIAPSFIHGVEVTKIEAYY